MHNPHYSYCKTYIINTVHHNHRYRWEVQAAKLSTVLSSQSYTTSWNEWDDKELDRIGTDIKSGVAFVRSKSDDLYR